MLLAAFSEAPHDCDRHAAHPYDLSKHEQVEGVSFYQIDVPAARAACEAALAEDPENAQFLFQLGRVRLASEQTDAAATLFRKAAEMGHAAAQAGVGTMYRTGNGAPQNDVNAVAWYRKSADQGFALGQFFLATMYFNGQGVSLDSTEEERWTEAVKWYLKAAEQGLAGAQYSLGPMYEFGLGGLDRDQAEALSWYRKAAEQGHSGAQFQLGISYERGRGVEADRDEAIAWYRKAASNGLPNAIEALERLESE